MDSLLVDLDKVLDDFEAEESLAPGRERTPSGYQEYLEKSSDFSWGPVDKTAASGVPADTENLALGDKSSLSVRYDFPYEPENFDLSEADFALSPSVGKNANNGTLEFTSDKVHLLKPKESDKQHVTVNVNGMADHGKEGDQEENEFVKEVLVHKELAKTKVESEQVTYPIQADLSPHSELPHVNGYPHGPTASIGDMEIPTKHIASFPSMSSIDSNSEYDKYPVQCNTPQTPKENPLINPLQTQIRSEKDSASWDQTVPQTTGALPASQTAMQDIPKLQSLKEELESNPQTNGISGQPETIQHQFTRPTLSLPASFHKNIPENGNSSLPTDLTVTATGCEEKLEIDIKYQEKKQSMPGNEQMDGQENCDMDYTEVIQKPNDKFVVGFGNDGDNDSDMDEQDLENYLNDEHANQYRFPNESGATVSVTSNSCHSTKHEMAVSHSDPYDVSMSDIYSKPKTSSGVNYGLNLQQKMKNTNFDSKLMGRQKREYENVDYEMFNPEDNLHKDSVHASYQEPGMEVLKVLPVTQDGAVELPQNVNTTSVITQPDTNLSPNANVSLDSGCASMDTAALSSPSGDRPANNGGARPKDINSRINRPNSLKGLPMVNMNSESPFVLKPAMSPTNQGEALESSDYQHAKPRFQESVVSREQKMVMEDSKQLMEVDGGDIGSNNANTQNNDNLTEDSVTSMDSTGEHSVNFPESQGIVHDACDNVDISDVEMRRGHSPERPNMGRPRSWSPADSGQPQVPKQKRPTSLNLPPPPTINPNNGRSQLQSEQSPVDQSGATGGAAMEPDSTAEEAGDPADDETVEGAEAMEIPTDPPLGQFEPPPPYTTSLGMVAPTWVPDAEASACMSCDVKFTFTKRRHHCRACGKVFCSACCSMKNRLPYMKNQEARVCVMCHSELALADCSGFAGGIRGPHPNNPSDYCSVVPPAQASGQVAPPPSVLVPVLKRDGHAGSVEGSARRSGEPKQVMFSDGIRPGGDLTELDGSSEINRMPPRRSRQQKRVERVSQGGQHSPRSRRVRTVADRTCKCLIPEDGLPPIAVPQAEGSGYDLQANPSVDEFMPKIKDEESPPVIFAVNTNLQVLVKIVNLECCVNRVVWCFTTKGLTSVGQEEIITVLETLPDEETVPRDIFTHLHNLYEDASKGNTVADMGHSIFNQSYLGSRDHGGFLYIRATFQCVQKLILPEPPFLFGILLQKWETPWAKVFPLRLLLRLGAEYRYYPCPLIGVRNRKPVFFEIGHTIMNLLADFRNYQYMLPSIRGVSIHMEDKVTKINFPTNRYDDLMKVVNNSNEHVMAIAANFSAEADSHLVCIQNDDGNYQTQAINIQNKPRKVTGASFVVFNGALKSSSGLSAKSSIVEDGLMIQISPDSMLALKQAIKDMQPYTIQCGLSGAPKPDETVIVHWVDEDRNVNIGVKSPIDGLSLDGIESLHVHNSTDYVGDKHIIRWTEIFFIQNEDGGSVKWEHLDLSRLGETLATACCMALTPHLEKLKEAGLGKIGLRIKLGADNVGYEAGAKGERLPDVYMNDLDNELIPVIHRATQQDGNIVLELIFQVLD